MSSKRGVKLKACPFCGKSSALGIAGMQVGTVNHYTGVHCYIDRGGCGAGGGTGYANDWQRLPTKDDAVRAWNKRTKGGTDADNVD